MLRGCVDAQDERRTQHALVTDAADFQPRSVAQRGYQGDDAVCRKVHMSYPLARPADNLGGTQLDLLEIRQQALPVRRGQCRHQTAIRN